MAKVSRAEQAKFEKKVWKYLAPDERPIWIGGTLMKSSLAERGVPDLTKLYIIPGVLTLLAVGFGIFLAANGYGFANIFLFFAAVMLVAGVVGVIRSIHSVNTYAVTDHRFMIIEKHSCRTYDIRALTNIAWFGTKREIGYISAYVFPDGLCCLRGINEPETVHRLICGAVAAAGGKPI